MFNFVNISSVNDFPISTINEYIVLSNIPYK